MSKKLLHTPEGVRDIYNQEIEKRDVIINQLKKLIKTYGYDNIKTPTFEYMEVYYNDISLRKTRELYKFTGEDGDTLVLRPDFTPSIARAASKYFTDEKNVRLFYEGNVFAKNKRYQGRLKESFQFGGELMGDGSIDADAEIIAIAVNSLRTCRLDEFQISIGHADIFKGLVEAGNFEEDDVEVISDYMFNRNVFGLEEFLEEKGTKAELINLFIKICKMYMPESEAWSELISESKSYDKLNSALTYLDELYNILKLYGVEKYISFEPGSVGGFDYYTGIIFAGYTYGSGEPIVAGGRYDNLLANFGKARPAIGFGILIDQLQFALDRQNLLDNIKRERTVICYEADARDKAISNANQLRSKGITVELVLVDGNFDDVRAIYEDENTGIMEIR